MRHHLFLLRELVKRDFQGRYAGSALGLVWSFLQPLWMLLLFTFVFSTVMKISLAGARTGHFAVFLFSGLLPWMAVQEGVSRASTAVTDNSNLVKKLSFPAEILVLADDHHHLFQGSISGPFTQSVDGTFNLSGSINDAGNRISSRQTKIIMAMTGDDCLINV